MKKNIKIIGLFVIIVYFTILIITYGYETYEINQQDIQQKEDRNNYLYFSYDSQNNSLLVEEVNNLVYGDFCFLLSKDFHNYTEYYVQDNMTLDENSTNVKFGPIKVGDRISLFEDIEGYELSIVHEPSNTLMGEWTLT